MEHRARKSCETATPFPRLLLGAAVIFWGWMVDLPLLGLMLALVWESSYWLAWRWDFGERAYVRAWSISILAMALTALLLWMEGIQPETVRSFVSWMPLFMATVQWTQVFGKSETIPLHTFSYFSRKKVAMERELGMNPRVPMVSFSAVYFVLCLLCSAAGKNAHDPLFLPGMLVLTGWCIWAFAGRSMRCPGPWFSAWILMCVVTVLMQWGLLRAHRYLMGRAVGGDAMSDSPSQWHRSNTHMGHVGQIKLSSDVFWRLRREQGVIPDLLMTASYNRYFPSGHWRYETQRGVTQEFDFKGLAAVGRVDRGVNAAEDEKLYRTTGEVPVGQENREDLPRFRLVGAVKTDALLPLPGSLYTLYVNAQELESNSVGTIRITPRHAVVEGVVRWDGGIDRDGMPFAEEQQGAGSIDALLPPQEREVLEQIVKELGLRELPLQEQIATLKLWFYRHFQYSTHLNIQGRLREKWQREEQQKRYRSIAGRDSLLAQFLLEEKAGHCEYFATATTLLLRAAGQKARYVVGFSVQERHPKTGEYLLRGTHAHAWCRVWNPDRQSWLNVDTTPPSWVVAEAGRRGWRRDVIDAMQRLRENFTIWRTQPANQSMVLGAMLLVGLGLFLWIFWRLWQTRVQNGQESVEVLWAGRSSPLLALEPILIRWIGVRPTGMPYGTWLKRLEGQFDAEQVAQWIVSHNRYLYDPRPIEVADEEPLRAMVRVLQESDAPHADSNR